MNGFANAVQIGVENGFVWCVSIDGSPDPVKEEHFLRCDSEEEAWDLVTVLRRMEAHTAERIAQWFERDSAFVNCREVKAIRAGTYRFLKDPEDLDDDLTWPMPC